MIRYHSARFLSEEFSNPHIDYYTSEVKSRVFCDGHFGDFCVHSLRQTLDTGTGNAVFAQNLDR